MREPRRSQLSSAFDDLLERNWQQFDSLQGGRGRRREGGAAQSGDAEITHKSDAASDGWRYEIIDRRREGDEAVVTCRLIVDDTGAEIVQQGRAPLLPPAGAPATAAASPFPSASATATRPRPFRRRRIRPLPHAWRKSRS